MASFFERFLPRKRSAVGEQAGALPSQRVMMRKSVATKLALVVCLVTAMMGVGVSLLAGMKDRDAYIERLYQQTERVFKAAIDPRFQTKADEVNRVVARLVVIDAIEGGALFDDTGHLQQTFGELPETAFEDTRRSGGAAFTVGDLQRIEFYYPPQTTGTPFHVLARVDIGQMNALEGAALNRIIAISLITGLCAGLGAIFISWRFVAAPLRRIGALMDRIITDPAGTDSDESLRTGPSEVGVLAAAVKRLRWRLAEIWRTRITVADAILDRSPFAILQMTAEGMIDSINPSGVRLLEYESGTTLLPRAVMVRDVATDNSTLLHELLQQHHDDIRLIALNTATDRYALAGSLTVSTDPQNDIRVAMLTDVTKIYGERLALETRFAGAKRLMAEARRREYELKLTLESCIMLLSGPGKQHDVNIDAVPFAVEWLEAAQENGIVEQSLMVNPSGPTVTGAEEDLRAVMRLGLLVCYARCGSAPVDMIVDAKGMSFETAGITIRAVPSAAETHPPGPAVADWRLAFAALRTAIRRVNGQLSEFSSNEEGTILRIALRGAAERMAAVRSR